MKTLEDYFNKNKKTIVSSTAPAKKTVKQTFYQAPEKKSFWESGAGSKLVDYQKNVIEKGNILPEFNTSKGNIFSKGAKFIANMPIGIINAIAGKGAAAPAYDITKSIGKRIKGEPLNYDEFVSPQFKLGAEMVLLLILSLGSLQELKRILRKFLETLLVLLRLLFPQQCLDQMLILKELL